MQTLTDFHVLDCGDTDGLRFQVWAEANDTEDTQRAASAFICSTDTRENAEMIARTMNVQKLFSTMQTA